ncbi:MAG TPA: AAA family ATPase [Candidatus Binataceae bacterium]|nr:AAA family ATPase [Candidatus Binataceae bacterium]
MTGFQLRRLQITGPNVADAEIEFGPGLNVVSGASDTGKSYLVETIDFMLGGGTPPRQIPESRGYDNARLSIIAHDGRGFELTRALQGGDFLLAELGAPGTAGPVTLGSRHSASTEENISTFLLRLVGLDGKRVRKNAQNELQNLSFRNLAHLVVIDEESIIKKGSPIHTGESTQRTVQASIFKLLLTGQDDSALIAAKKPVIAKAELEAQIALLDQLIADYERELGGSTQDPAGLDGQLERLSASIIQSERALSIERSAFEQQERQRRAAWQTRDEGLARQAEIAGLLERFALLNEHYGSDLDRLEAVSEAGFFFVALDAGTCPLCGAPAGDHRHDGVPHDGDIVALRAACDREIAKIRQLQAELTQAVGDLNAEEAELRTRLEAARLAFREADALVRETLAPALSAARAENSRLLETRSEVRQALSLVERIADLRRKRADAQAALGTAGRISDDRPGLPPASVQAFSASVEELLVAWHFPHEKPIYFDERGQDLVLGSRRRGEQGKGLRALTHAAFSLGLEQTCRNLRLPAIGFVMLDSPLVTFREAEAEEAGLDAGARLEVKQAFYRDLASRIRTDQVIIVENEDPEVGLRGAIVSHIFTKRLDQGRAGFFPIRPAPAIFGAEQQSG